MNSQLQKIGKDCENIIWKFHHNLSMKDVRNELKQYNVQERMIDFYISANMKEVTHKGLQREILFEILRQCKIDLNKPFPEGFYIYYSHHVE